MKKFIAVAVFALFLCASGEVYGARVISNKTAIELYPGSEVLLGDQVNIRLVGLQRHKRYELTADLIDQWGRAWRSSAAFVAGSSSIIDLSKDSPVEGDYSGVDPLGMFWSGRMQGLAPKIDNTSIPATSSIVTFILTCDGQVVATRQLKRWLVAPGVRVSEIREKKLVAALYEPGKKGRHPAVILLGGSGGGILWQRVMAGLLASHGYSALALAYFNMEGLPRNIDRIPLEYFREAIDLLKQRPGVDPSRIAVIGYSRGAELSLLLGSQFQDLSAVVGYAPSFVVFQSFAPPDFPKTSSFTLAGNEFPFLPYKRPRPNATSLEIWMDHLSNAAAVEKAVIPVEKTKGAILLLSGKGDLTWPSTLMADRVVERLRSAKFPYDFLHQAYEDAGHAIAQPGYLPTIESVSRNNNGGTAQGTARAQADSWKRLIEFLRQHLSKLSNRR